ncbi:hypothetical protein [Paractinoplanes durhamensis]|uniref:hypothetical protein n=1 Tax=Paractinoplanes durhamensis TaxID=113563 RepID=UPI0036296536
MRRVFLFGVALAVVGITGPSAGAITVPRPRSHLSLTSSATTSTAPLRWPTSPGMGTT